MNRVGRHRRAGRIAVALLALAAGLVVVDGRRADAAGRLLGSGSSYVYTAMRAWTDIASARGVQVDYQPIGSPVGLSQYAQRLMDFAGSEAEFSALGSTATDAENARRRGFQYVPDVAGAIGVMYHVDDAAGREVDYLRLSPGTIAKIFMGAISRWNDPAIAADNADANLKLPDQPITVVYRTGLSGTTALFYDYVANVEPGLFSSWARAHGQPQNNVARIISFQNDSQFAPHTQGLNSSEQIAQTIASGAGKWWIGYDEFSFALTYGTKVARVRNASGAWVLPAAANISAALESALLRADLSQELSKVYTSTNPLTYPISAYSYLVTQCSPSPDRDTCAGPYADGGKADSLAQFMRMVACEGQADMHRIGYSPLPPNLSQEMANSIGRMLGRPPEKLTSANCGNPRLRGDFKLPGSPPDKVEEVKKQRAQQGGGGGGGSGGPAAGDAGNTATTGPDGQSTDPDAAQETAAEATASGRGGPRVGGGSGETRAAEPAEYTRPIAQFRTLLPLVVLLLIIAVPTLFSGVLKRRARRP